MHAARKGAIYRAPLWPRRIQLHENVLLHCVATRFTHACVQDPPAPQQDGIAAQTAVVQVLQVLVSPTPVAQTLCGQLTPPGPLQEVPTAPAQ
jgi:hypothetical protein